MKIGVDPSSIVSDVEFSTKGFDPFLGSIFPDRENRNLAALKHLDDMFQSSRVNKDSYFDLAILITYFPLGIILSLIRIIVLLPLFSLLIFLLPRKAQCFFLRIQSFLLFGLWISVNGKPSLDAKIWVSNHLSTLFSYYACQ
jgi:hypothetical protein